MTFMKYSYRMNTSTHSLFPLCPCCIHSHIRTVEAISVFANRLLVRPCEFVFDCILRPTYISSKRWTHCLCSTFKSFARYILFGRAPLLAASTDLLRAHCVEHSLFVSGVVDHTKITSKQADSPVPGILRLSPGFLNFGRIRRSLWVQFHLTNKQWYPFIDVTSQSIPQYYCCQHTQR